MSASACCVLEDTRSAGESAVLFKSSSFSCDQKAGEGEEGRGSKCHALAASHERRC